MKDNNTKSCIKNSCYSFARLLLCIVVSFFGFKSEVSVAQPYGNEWMVPTQRYIKIPVTQNGIYRVYKDSLDAIGISLGGVNPRKIQVFYRGQEISRFIPNENDGLFSNGEYVEFYGRAADGSNSKALYRQAAFQSNPFKSIYCDTSFYFLTWANSPFVNGKSMRSYGQLDDLKPFNTQQIKEELLVFSNQYSFGRGYLELSSRIHHSYFDLGEGPTGVLTNGPVSFGISNLTDVDPAAQSATLEVCVNGRNGRDHLTRISIGNDQNATFSVDTVAFTGYDYRVSISQIPAAFLQSNNFFVRLTPLNNQGSIPDFVSPTYIKLTYARGLDMANSTQPLTTTLFPQGGDSYLKVPFRNVVQTAKFYDITDPLNVRQLIVSDLPNGSSAISADGVSNGLKLFYSPSFLVIGKGQLKVVNQRSYIDKPSSFVAIYHPSLTKRGGAFDNPVKAYTSYRASLQGGRYDTLSASIQDLYDQFSFGEKSPEAIRRFVDYLADNNRIQYLLLLGKGLGADFGGGPNNLVPCWGNPGSDIFTISEINGSGTLPVVPVGRVSSATPEELASYLSKVIEHESLTFDLQWRKKQLMLSGGRTVTELTSFRTYLNQYASIARAPYLGGQVTTLNKQSNSIIEFINIQDQLNAGIAHLTVFGHSSNSGADVDFGRPTDPGLLNKGKYPLIMINGCRGGNIYDIGGSLNEDWVLAREKGAIAFIGNSDEAFPTLLNEYVTRFFKSSYNDSTLFSKPIGLIQKEVIRSYMASFSTTFDSILIDQFTLHGDPVLSIFPAKKADYAVSNSSLFIQEANPTANSPVLTLGIPVTNWAKALPDSVVIGVRRFLPDGSSLLYNPIKARPILYRDTLYFSLPKPIRPTAGLNAFEVKVNFYDSIPEYSYANNTARLELFLREASVKALLPMNYGIVSSSSVQLLVQSSTPLTTPRGFQFEVDTTQNFNSPIKITVRSSGFDLVSATVNIPPINNTVWFWRARFSEIINPADSTYSRASFTYIAGSPDGWSQSSFMQQVDNRLSTLSRDFRMRKLVIPDLRASLNITASGSTIGASDVVFNGISIINGSGNDCAVPDRLITMMVNHKTLNTYLYPYTGDINRPWLYSCGREPVAFTFHWNVNLNRDLSASSGGRSTLISQIEESLEDKDYFLMMNSFNVSVNNWSPNMRSKLALVGVDTNAFKQLRPGDPFIILGRKGMPYGTANQVYPNFNSPTPGSQQTISLNTNLVGLPEGGEVISTVIGPASTWTRLLFDIPVLEASDSVRVDVYGQDINGRDTLLFQDVSSDFPLSAINARLFPYIYLKAYLFDAQNQTLPQLKSWKVLFTSVPEGVALVGGRLNPNLGTVSEGASIGVKIGFRNISNLAFGDSLTVRTTVSNLSSGRQWVGTTKINPTQTGQLDTIRITNLPTTGFTGENRLDIFVNPRVLPELYYDNNLIQSSYKVQPDRSQPILDVAFDGVRIMDGDIVNPSPHVSIILKDDNRLRPKVDTTGLVLLLTPPGQNASTQRISFADPRVVVSPGTSSNPFKLDFRPGKLEDGRYRLQIQGADASGNLSGNLAYAISFTVINESRLSHFYPYPNPFSSSTRFVFTLTGSVIPDQIKIQIMTISGKVVREITKNELGPIRIGNNLSSFAWDGTDEYGDKLANGVYFYRVQTHTESTTFDSFKTAGDDMFKNGFGKMYIMR